VSLRAAAALLLTEIVRTELPSRSLPVGDGEGDCTLARSVEGGCGGSFGLCVAIGDACWDEGSGADAALALLISGRGGVSSRGLGVGAAIVAGALRSVEIRRIFLVGTAFALSREQALFT